MCCLIVRLKIDSATLLLQVCYLVFELYWIEFFRINVDELYKPSVGRLIIMVIDALRWDFVEGAEGRMNMPYTASLIDGKKACLLTGKAGPPTVTMPRIKVGSAVLLFINRCSKKVHSKNFCMQE